MSNHEHVSPSIPALSMSTLSATLAIVLFQILIIGVISVVLIGCEDIPSKNSSWDKDIALTKARDINSAPKIVEINLEASATDIELRPGVFTKMWTYNGIFPGPTIEANVGDTLIVNFTNNLNTESTIHWHGIELPANMDGSMIAQTTVAGGGGTFRYEFKLLNAATYWYHPHVQSDVQVEKGLYGALIVREPEIDKQHNLPERETTIIFDDILLDSTGQIAAPSYEEPIDPINNALTQLNGREGNVFLVNGRPFDSGTSVRDNTLVIKVHSGTPVRLRFINAANARFFRLSVPDHNIYQIGGDGGLLPSPLTKPPITIIDTSNPSKIRQKVSSRDGEPLALISDPDLDKGIMLVPGERSDIIFTPNGNAGEFTYLEWHFFPRGYHGIERDNTGNLIINHNHQPASTLPFRILKFEFDDTSIENQAAYTPPIILKDIPLISVTNSTPKLPIIFGHGLPDPGTGNINFFAAKDADGNGAPFGMVGDDISLYATPNQTYIWEVTNLTQGDHPFHPHGFTFQHISTEYIDSVTAENNKIEMPIFPNELKDTIRIPARPGAKGMSKTIVKLAVNFSDAGREGHIEASGKTPFGGRSGGWFVHCHILEHSNRGMGTYLNLLY